MLSHFSCITFCFSHITGSIWMLWWGIYNIQFKRFITKINYIVPFASRYHNSITIRNSSLKI